MKTLIAIALILAPGVAAACSCMPLPDWGFYVASETTVPANVRGLLWAPMHNGKAPAPADFEIRRADGQAKAAVPIEIVAVRPGLFLIQADVPLTPGATYLFKTTRFNAFRFRADDPPDAPRAEQVVRVTVAAEPLKLPAELPLTQAPSEEATVGVPASGSCSRAVRARTAKVKVALPDSLAPYAEHLVYTTLIDGQPAPAIKSSLCGFTPPGRTWAGTAEDLLFRACGLVARASAASGRPKDGEQVAIEVSLPGTEQRVTTKPVTLAFGECSPTVLTPAP